MRIYPAGCPALLERYQYYHVLSRSVLRWGPDTPAERRRRAKAAKLAWPKAAHPSVNRVFRYHMDPVIEQAAGGLDRVVWNMITSGKVSNRPLRRAKNSDQDTAVTEAHKGCCQEIWAELGSKPERITALSQSDQGSADIRHSPGPRPQSHSDHGGIGHSQVHQGGVPKVRKVTARYPQPMSPSDLGRH